METGIVFGLVLSTCFLRLALYTTIVCNIIIMFVFAMATMIAAVLDAEEVFGALIVMFIVEVLIVVHQTHDQCRPCLQYFILETTEHQDNESGEDESGSLAPSPEVEMMGINEHVNQTPDTNHIKLEEGGDNQDLISLKLRAYNADT